MGKAEVLRARLSVPVIVAPMFIASDTNFVTTCCRAGLLGTFPALNGRTSEAFETMLRDVTEALRAHSTAHPDRPAAPYGVNLIVHRSNPRLERDLELCVQYRTPLIVTNLGKPGELVDTVHAYGGVVFSSVTTIDHARKAAEAGVDGLVLICAGAGGHAGTLNPFAFAPGVREWFDGMIAVAGCISDGRSVRACEALGADFAWVGTRFIATREARATDAYKAMLVAAEAADIVYTAVVSGIPANFIRANLAACGYDVTKQGEVRARMDIEAEYKLWKDIWTAGQGVQTIHETISIDELAACFKAEYDAAER